MNVNIVNQIIIPHKLVGTISPENILDISAVLFAKIPYAGQIEHARIDGPLTAGLKFGVNVVLAKGSGQLSAKPDGAGNYDLYISLHVDLKFLARFDVDDLKLIRI